MCGIVGFFDPNERFAPEPALARLQHMTDALRLRGPDDQGVWLAAEQGIALGHRRLSILDLSVEGHQPMQSAGGRYTISFNGEIYNYRELQRELTGAGVRFRGTSDTEVLVAAIEAWGVTPTLKRLNGMFAFALWDSQRRELSLARDRFGEKPLFYGWCDGRFVFASELKALRTLPEFDRSIDLDALAQFFRFAYVPHPRSIHPGARKLPPATSLTIAAGTPRGRWPTPQAYWSLSELVESHPPLPKLDRAVDELDELLRESVRLRMVADVPLGALLSGGIDSSTIVALMQAQSSRKVATFSIGFDSPAYSEAQHARAVAAHLGTDHHEMVVTPADALAVVPRLPEIYDEPFADVSQIPTYLVSRFARRHVSVALSGDAGDEVFLGYNRHVWVGRTWDAAKHVPQPLRRLLAKSLLARPTSWWDRRLAALGHVVPSLRQRHAGEKVHKLAGVLDSRTPEEMFLGLCSQWLRPLDVVPRAEEPPSLHGSAHLREQLPEIAERMAFVDTLTYLPDDILAKVDRATMASSLEGRVPFLDPEVVRFAWRLPLDWKIRSGTSKWILRRVLARYVPESLTNRPKQGFAVPLDEWLRGPLRGLVEDALSSSSSTLEGLEVAPVRRAWREHVSEIRNNQYLLWSFLMFALWRANLTAEGPVRV